MPRSDRLREWYLSMLRCSKEKGVVTHLSNLYDTFFDGGRDHREKASATAMPYLDGAFPSYRRNSLLLYGQNVSEMQVGGGALVESGVGRWPALHTWLCIRHCVQIGMEFEIASVSCLNLGLFCKGVTKETIDG